MKNVLKAGTINLIRESPDESVHQPKSFRRPPGGHWNKTGRRQTASFDSFYGTVGGIKKEPFLLIFHSVDHAIQDFFGYLKPFFAHPHHTISDSVSATDEMGNRAFGIKNYRMSGIGNPTLTRHPLKADI